MQPPPARTVKVAIEGCAHGELDSIYASLQNLERVENIKVELLICCGDFQAVRNQDDLRNLCAPEKYLHMNTFYKYYSGEKRAPVLTVFVGGNHEAYNHLRELPYGGWVAPNIYYLGASGVVNFKGLRIAGYTGIYKRQHYNKGYYELPPYNHHDLHSVFHVRVMDVLRLSALRRPLDVFVSHDWPRNISKHGNEAQLLRVKPFLRADIASGEFGSEPGEHLLHTLRPRYWFSAHMHCRFAALVRHPDGRETRFLALDKVLPGRDFLQVLDLPVSDDAAAAAPPGLAYDAEWLALLRRTHPMVSLTRYAHMPDQLAPVTAEEEAFVREQLRKLGALVPENFTATVPAHPATGRTTAMSPQLAAQLRLLDVGLAPAAAGGAPLTLDAAAADPNAIALDDDDDVAGGGEAAKAPSALDKAVRANPDEINLDDL